MATKSKNPPDLTLDEDEIRLVESFRNTHNLSQLSEDIKAHRSKQPDPVKWEASFIQRLQFALGRGRVNQPASVGTVLPAKRSFTSRISHFYGQNRQLINVIMVVVLVTLVPMALPFLGI